MAAVLVTAASKGIGHATAVELARRFDPNESPNPT